MARLNRKFASPGLREQLAEEAARLMIEQGIGDYAVAKRKAADRLRVSSRGVLPSNRQIEERLVERQRIFEPEDHPDRLETLRSLAMRIMDELAAFEPRLVGSVLAGTATINAVVELHVFCDSPEEVASSLSVAGRDFRAVERRLRVNRKHTRLIPAFRLSVDGEDVIVYVFPERGIRQAPLSPIDQKPMKRARCDEVAALVRGQGLPRV